MQYSPDRRTALVFSGTGVDGAYHAGALRALNEAGVRVDLLAGHGIGTVGALFGAIDGGSRLWDPGGLWRSAAISHLYSWRVALRRLVFGLVIAGLLLTIPALVLAASAAVFQLALLLDSVRPGTAAWLTPARDGMLAAAFAPGALPTRLPQLVTAVIAIVVVGVLVAAVRARRAAPTRRDVRDGVWWSVLGAPLSPATPLFVTGLWDLLRGGAQVRQPALLDLSRRYAELLTDSLDQPGFRELLLVAHDLDARQDLVFALLATPWRRAFFLRRQATGHDRRSADRQPNDRQPPHRGGKFRLREQQSRGLDAHDPTAGSANLGCPVHIDAILPRCPARENRIISCRRPMTKSGLVDCRLAATARGLQRARRGGS